MRSLGMQMVTPQSPLLVMGMRFRKLAKFRRWARMLPMLLLVSLRPARVSQMETRRVRSPRHRWLSHALACRDPKLLKTMGRRSMTTRTLRLTVQLMAFTTMLSAITSPLIPLLGSLTSRFGPLYDLPSDKGVYFPKMPMTLFMAADTLTFLRSATCPSPP